MINILAIIFCFFSNQEPNQDLDLEIRKVEFNKNEIHIFLKKPTASSKKTVFEFQQISNNGIASFEFSVGPETVSFKIGDFDKQECFVLLGRLKNSIKHTVVYLNDKNSNCNLLDIKKKISDKKMRKRT